MPTRRQVLAGLGALVPTLALGSTARAAKNPDRATPPLWLPLYTPPGEIVWSTPAGQSGMPLTLWYTPPGVPSTLRLCAWVLGRGRVSLDFGETATELDVDTATPTPIELIGQMSARGYAVPIRVFTLSTGSAALDLQHPNLFVTTV